jgi:RND family efflux transporter MFP subunit
MKENFFISKLCAVLWLLGCATFISCGKKAEPATKPPSGNAIPVTVGKVKTVLMNRSIPVVGTLFAKDEATIAAQVEGQVEKTRVDFGDRVTAGQDLALIDTASYEALEKQAEATLAKAQASAVNAEQTLQRNQALQKEKVSSESEADKALADAGQARAEVKAAEAALTIAKLNLARSYVKAPFDGAIAERVASAGDFLKLGEPLFRIVDDSVLKFIVQVPESYAGLISKQQAVIFSVDAFPANQFEAKVYLISPQVNTGTRSFGVGSLVQNPDHNLRANTFARGELMIEKDVPTFVVPLEAVVNFAGINKVFVLENEKATSRPVQTGRIKEGWQEIVSGVKEGDSVVLTGQSKLHDGANVRIKTGASPK